MGQKSSRTRNYILYCFTTSSIIVAITLAACAPFHDKFARMKAHHQLEQHRYNLAEGFFETVIEESMQVIERSETEPPADVAFYALGEVYAHHDNRGRDYYLSQYYFEKLIENFPDSNLNSEAKTYLSLIKSINAREEETAAVEKPSKMAEDNSYQTAAKNNLRVLQEAGNNKPADKALYNLGLIYAHAENPAKDYKKSQTYFHLLTTQFPDSEFKVEAEVILGLFETIRKIQQIDRDIEQQRKQLVR